MFKVNDFAADFVVQAASAEADRLEQLANSNAYRADNLRQKRQLLRKNARELRMVVAGINTGDGVTRTGT